MTFRAAALAVTTLLAYLTLPVHANDQDRPSRVWQQISMPGFDIVYPEGLETEARYVANRLGSYWPALTESMPAHKGKK